jgi:hypothetical protein
MVLLRRYHRDVRSPILAGGVFRGQVNMVQTIVNFGEALDWVLGTLISLAIAFASRNSRS